MSRTLSSANLTEIAADHLHVVILVKFLFDTPAYVHSGIGSITYDGNTYTGVGDLGSIDSVGESEDLRPMNVRLSMSGVSSQYITEALDSGNYGDVITIYKGYRQDDGTLVDDPWILWSGTYEHAQILEDDTATVTITAVHDLAILDEADGSRFTDEDQKQRYASDNGFEYVHLQAEMKLMWGGRPTQPSGLGTGAGSSNGREVEVN
jgi:hypothetical protein